MSELGGQYIREIAQTHNVAAPTSDLLAGVRMPFAEGMRLSLRRDTTPTPEFQQAFAAELEPAIDFLNRIQEIEAPGNFDKDTSLSDEPWDNAATETMRLRPNNRNSVRPMSGQLTDFWLEVRAPQEVPEMDVSPLKRSYILEDTRLPIIVGAKLGKVVGHLLVPYVQGPVRGNGKRLALGHRRLSLPKLGDQDWEVRRRAITSIDTSQRTSRPIGFLK